MSNENIIDEYIAGLRDAASAGEDPREARGIVLRVQVSGTPVQRLQLERIEKQAERDHGSLDAKAAVPVRDDVDVYLGRAMGFES